MLKVSINIPHPLEVIAKPLAEVFEPAQEISGDMPG